MLARRLRAALLFSVLAGAPGWVALARAEAQDDRPTLNIPGLPPLPLPPGSRAFGPGGPIDTRPSASGRAADKAPAASASRAPHPDMNTQAGRTLMLEDLFGRLGHADDETSAKGISLAIERLWMRSGSDTADVLMSRAVQALSTEDLPLTTQLLDSIVAIEPDWAEGWNKRATARFLADDYAGALEDIGHTLALEPRHFGALSGMAAILQKSGMKAGALRVFRRVLDISPQQEDLRSIVDKLTLEVEGRPL